MAWAGVVFDIDGDGVISHAEMQAAKNRNVNINGQSNAATGIQYADDIGNTVQYAEGGYVPRPPSPDELEPEMASEQVAVVKKANVSNRHFDHSKCLLEPRAFFTAANSHFTASILLLSL